MKILIIGGTGNISLPLTLTLVDKGHDVYLYNRGNQRIDGAHQIIGDRTQHSRFEAQIAELGCIDCVIDMVGYHPDDARCAVSVFSGKVGQFIFCSTVDVYTKTRQLYPIREDAQRYPSPEFSYAHDKAEMEEIFIAASESSSFPLTIIRPAATYNDTWTPIPLIGSGLALLKRIRLGKPIIVLGDGQSIWVSTHRDDVAEAFVGAVGNDKAVNRAYNATGDEWMTWQMYYQTAARAMGAPEVEFTPIATELLGKMAPRSAEWSLVNFRYNNIFDNSAAKADLGFRYRVSWHEGVSRMIAYADSRGAIDTAVDERLYDAIVGSYKKTCDELAICLRGFDS